MPQIKEPFLNKECLQKIVTSGVVKCYPVFDAKPTIYWTPEVVFENNRKESISE